MSIVMCRGTAPNDDQIARINSEQNQSSCNHEIIAHSSLRTFNAAICGKFSMALFCVSVSVKTQKRAMENLSSACAASAWQDGFVRHFQAKRNLQTYPNHERRLWEAFRNHEYKL